VVVVWLVCPLCHLRGYQGDQRHHIKDCWREEAQQIYQESQDIWKGIHKARAFEKFSCCTWCEIPQAICEKWQQKEEQGWWEEVEGGRCQYDGILVEGMVTMLQVGEDGVDEEVFQWMEDDGVNVKDQQEVFKWFGRRVEWGGIEATKMVQVFHRLARIHNV
jgi:hypothetical protein